MKPTEIAQMLTLAMDGQQEAELRRSSLDWHERNGANHVSGSTFATCLRQAYYRYMQNEVPTPDDGFVSSLDEQNKRYMYFGLLVEDLIIKAVEGLGIKNVTVHRDQTQLPVQQFFEYEENDRPIVISAANDMVLEITKGKRSQFIPVEIKTTDRIYSRKEGDGWVTPQKWWDNFTGRESNVKQVAQWMHLATLNGYDVPYGLLFYLRRATWDMKYVVVNDSSDPVLINPDDRICKVINFRDVWIESRNQDLLKAISTQTPPLYDKDEVPDYICKGCPFLQECKETR